MQNVAISASAPVKSVQLVTDGKTAMSSGGFLQQLLGALIAEPGQQTNNLTPANMLGLVQETAEEVPEQTQTAAAMSGALAMLLALPVQLSEPSATGQPTETSAPNGEVTLALSPEPVSGTGQQVVSSEALTRRGKSSENLDTVSAKQTEAVTDGEQDGSTKQAIAETKVAGSGVITPSSAERDTPAAAAPIIRKPTLVAAYKPSDKSPRAQVDDIVGHMWRQSLITRQQTTPGPVPASEPEQAVSLQAITLSQSEPALQTGTATGMFIRLSDETASEDTSTAISETLDLEKAMPQLAGDAQQASDSMVGEDQPTPVSLKGVQNEDSVGSKPNAEFADSLASAPEVPAAQAGRLSEEQASHENDLSGLSGLKDAVRIGGLDPVQQQVTGTHAPPKAWPTPHEQVLRGLEAGIKQLQASRIGERTTVKLQLFPEELGEVRVKLELIGRTVTAQFEASSTTTASMLKDGLPALRQALDSQGFHEVSLTAGFAGDFGQAREGRDEHAPRQQRVKYPSLQQAVLETGSREAPSKLANARLDYRL